MWSRGAPRAGCAASAGEADTKGGTANGRLIGANIHSARSRGHARSRCAQCRRKLRCRRWAVRIHHSGRNVATNLLAQIERLRANLQGLGVRRLTALAVIGVAAFAVTGLAGWYLSRPTMETLYSGLDRDDIAAIGAALREAGVPFDVNAESTVVLTPA